MTVEVKITDMKPKMREIKKEESKVKELKPVPAKETAPAATLEVRAADAQNDAEIKAWLSTTDPKIIPLAPLIRETGVREDENPAPASKSQRTGADTSSFYETVRQQEATRYYSPLAPQRPSTIVQDTSSLERTDQFTPTHFESPESRQITGRENSYESHVKTQDMTLRRKRPWEH